MSEQFPKVIIGQDGDAFSEAPSYFAKYIEPHIPKGWSNSTGSRDIGFEWGNDNDPENRYIFQSFSQEGPGGSLVIMGLIFDQYTEETCAELVLDSPDAVRSLFSKVSQAA